MFIGPLPVGETETGAFKGRQPAVALRAMEY